MNEATLDALHREEQAGQSSKQERKPDQREPKVEGVAGHGPSWPRSLGLR